MSVRVFNAPDVSRIQSRDVINVSDTSRDRNFSSGYTYVRTPALGTDLLNLSDDYSHKPKKKAEPKKSYANIFRMMFLAAVALAILSSMVSAMIVMGGIISVIVFSLVVLFSVFLYSINLNPFDKKTYKKLKAYMI